MDTRNWEQVLDGLRVPFAVEVVAWKPQTISRERKRCLAVPYVDTQPYQERLDQVCPEWQDDYAIWFSDPQEALGRGGEKRVISGKVFVKCRLTIAEHTRTDVGECELTDENALTSAKAQAFKRACAAFGLGRYLYDLPKAWVDYDAERGITEVELKKLEGLLRRFTETHPARAERSGPPEAEGRPQAERLEQPSRAAALPVRAEANGQGVRVPAGHNGFAAHPAGGTNGDTGHAAPNGARPAGTSQPGGDLRRPPVASGRTAGLGAGIEAGRPNEKGLTRNGVSQPSAPAGSRSEADRPAPDGQPADAPQDRQPMATEHPEHETRVPVDGGQPPAEAIPSEERREAPKSQARKKSAEGASTGKAANPGATQPGDSTPTGPAGRSAPAPLANDEGEGPVLCPIHNVPLQLLVTREGKALLLHKIEGSDAASPGYCNGQEVRQVARS